MNHERTIREYFDGWRKKDWSAVEALLADGFTFISPNDDADLDKRRYQEECWPEAERLKAIDIDTVIEKGDEAFVRYHGRFEGERVHNTEHFRFVGGKIKSIEVFFGRP